MTTDMEDKKQIIRKRLTNVILLVIGVFLLCYPLYVLVGEGGYFHYSILGHMGFRSMMLELVIWFLVAMLGYKNQNMIWLIAELFLFSYLHFFFLPILFSFLYIVGTVLLGDIINERWIKYNKAGKIYINLLIGMMFLTISFAILSLFKQGRISNLRIFTVILFLVTALSFWIKHRNNIVTEWKQELMQLRIPKIMYVLMAITMLFLMLQIGRANLSLDYDSVWYGLRSEFVLDNATGIYDDLKMSTFVYTYSKGFEIYALPFAGLSSYGFMYAVNVMLVFVVLMVMYSICRIFMSRVGAAIGVVLLAAVPGVMNMSITAKSDISTLLIQVIMIYFSLLYVKEKESTQLVMVWVCYIYSQTLKPSSAIFSSTILMAFIFICLVYKIKSKKTQGVKGYGLLLLSVLDISLVWGRTYYLTGIPANTLWGSLFKMLGMQYKYPYLERTEFMDFSKLSTISGIKSGFGRLGEFFLAPYTDEAMHVIIAWGTTLCTFMGVMAIVVTLFNFKNTCRSVKRNPQSAMMALLFLGELFGCIACLYILYQVDGNYFHIYYVVTIITGLIVLEKTVHKHVSAKMSGCIISLFVGLNIIFTGAGNWAGVSEFCKIDWINKGYYNHKNQVKKEINDRGCYEIYDILSERKDTKVFAFGQHPQVLQFPCIIEDALEISVWGNIELLSTPENFVQMVKYQNYDYIYIWPDFLEAESSQYYNVKQLFTENMISEVLCENRNILLTIDHGVSQQDSDANWEKFNYAIQKN